MLLGASEEVGAQEQRTPSQIAEIVVDAFANHLAIARMPLAIVGQEVELFMAIWTLAETEFPEFPRAVCKADRFWAAIPPIVRRSLLSRQHEDRAVGVNALRLYLQTMYYTNEAEAELADAIIYGWVTGGLFDMLDEMMEAILVQVEGPSAFIHSHSCAVLIPRSSGHRTHHDHHHQCISEAERKDAHGAPGPASSHRCGVANREVWTAARDKLE